MTIKKQSNLKKLDILLLILFPVLATFTSLLLKTNYFISTILFFVVPSIYYSLRTPYAIKKLLPLLC
ncbi:hypothetical protein CO165_01470 [Candidatus Roizmanbacteria bacterium CG_4_9_14_3_um_filter_33_18]|uniref:Uncharacterized protein n=3 Tax=Candidatus Roizmaniibacteriota TaxID=1752723 RepID=A0A2M7UAL6_9BACT|nr:MAG: hypothetical protein COW97_00500 [Candidatus Roizmanbacteria bacterium CG22_combo_CG10-13_8_21_14_all_34_12]PIZ68280.1 MAG: hypothetical protein COY12_00415 [Candidatus Roizmanbacteria bacterium CG_4_10_14_0_2_um_filter_33_96]PJA55841.1 MAG: hypothetical protein CO165_01470 [Candidatus Roizmanbacteria bacterium CG_4_9_14_3_um_filter_33_18]